MKDVIELYHGTTHSSYELIKADGINVRINFKESAELDFGYGFYLSKYKWYAKQIAISKITPTGDDDSDYPVVVVCRVKIKELLDSLPNDDKLIFRIKNLRFLSTVFNARYCRAGVDTIGKKYVYGPVADGNVEEVMPFYKKHESRSAVPTTKDIILKAYCYMRYLMPVFTKQHVIKDEELCKYIEVSEEPIRRC